MVAENIITTCPIRWNELENNIGLILIEGNTDPINFPIITEENFDPPAEKSCRLFDSLAGITVIGTYESEEGEMLPIVRFLYNKEKDGKLEVTERVIAVTGMTYGVHIAHAGQDPAHYITGVQIGSLDPITGQVTLAETSDKPVEPNNYSLDCIVGGSCGDTPVLANGGPERTTLPPERNLPVVPLHINDIEALREILVERLDVIDEDMNGPGTTRSEHVINRLRASLENDCIDTGKFFVIKDEEGKALGIIGVKSITSSLDGQPQDDMQCYVTTDHALEIVNVYVAKHAARNGLGGKLVQHVVNWARNEGYEELVLNSGKRNKKRSWPFWNRHLSCVGILNDYYGKGADAPVWRIGLNKRIRPSSLINLADIH